MKRKQIGTAEIRRIRADKEPKEIICAREINDNIKRVFANKPLTRPLSALQRNCEFKKRYNFAWKLRNEDKIKEERKYYNQKHKKDKSKYQKEYRQRPEVKARKEEYYKEYIQRPGVKTRIKEYRKRPEVKARKKENSKRWELRNETTK